MDALGIPDAPQSVSIEQRIENVLELTRRVELLDDLLLAAWERRRLANAASLAEVKDEPTTIACC